MTPKNDWEKEFDKRFTRTSRGLETKGQYRDDWFVKEAVTAREIKEFLRTEKSKSEAETLKKVLEVVEELRKKEDPYNSRGDKYWIEYSRALSDLTEKLLKLKHLQS